MICPASRAYFSWRNAVSVMLPRNSLVATAKYTLCRVDIEYRSRISADIHCMADVNIVSNMYAYKLPFERTFIFGYHVCSLICVSSGTSMEWLRLINPSQRPLYIAIADALEQAIAR